MDANVISCNASSAGGTMVELVDSHGCVKRPDLLTRFAKTRNTNGVEADLMLYSYLKVGLFLTLLLALYIFSGGE